MPTYDFKTQDAFLGEATEVCPVIFSKPEGSYTGTNLDLYKVASPSDVWGGVGFSGVTYTTLVNTFGESLTDTWTGGKLVICQIAGEYSVDEITATPEN